MYKSCSKTRKHWRQTLQLGREREKRAEEDSKARMKEQRPYTERCNFLHQNMSFSIDPQRLDSDSESQTGPYVITQKRILCRTNCSSQNFDHMK